uniref:Putative secreted protein n=1 Tax=Ixodes ricinus TaxID=34613 RepID=A0A6B0UEW7_IXORI
MAIYLFICSARFVEAAAGVVHTYTHTYGSKKSFITQNESVESCNEKAASLQCRRMSRRKARVGVGINTKQVDMQGSVLGAGHPDDTRRLFLGRPEGVSLC